MTLLLDRTLAVRPQEEALALANIDGLGGASALPVPLALELMAEVSSLVFPHRVLTRLKKAVFRAPIAPVTEVTCRAVRRGDGLLAEVLALGAPGTDQVLAGGLIVMGDNQAQPPALPAWETWMLDRRRRTENADGLYATSAERPVEIPSHQRTLRWAYTTGLGQLLGRIGPRGPHFGKHSETTPTASSPGVVEAMLQLVQWQWYALAGEDGQISKIAHIDWYRTPRAEEDVLVQVSCTGTTGASPIFNAIAYGPDRLPVIRLSGVALQTQRVNAPLPRLAWQSFVRTLETAGT